MKVSGAEAPKYQAVRRDTLHTVNKGVLVMADDDTGEIEWKDKTGQTQSLKLGAGAIRILPVYGYGR